MKLFIAHGGVEHSSTAETVTHNKSQSVTIIILSVLAVIAIVMIARILTKKPKIISEAIIDKEAM